MSAVRRSLPKFLWSAALGGRFFELAWLRPPLRWWKTTAAKAGSRARFLATALRMKAAPTIRPTVHPNRVGALTFTNASLIQPLFDRLPRQSERQEEAPWTITFGKYYLADQSLPSGNLPLFNKRGRHRSRETHRLAGREVPTLGAKRGAGRRRRREDFADRCRFRERTRISSDFALRPGMNILTVGGYKFIRRCFHSQSHRALLVVFCGKPKAASAVVIWSFQCPSRVRPAAPVILRQCHVLYAPRAALPASDCRRRTRLASRFSSCSRASAAASSTTTSFNPSALNMGPAHRTKSANAAGTQELTGIAVC